MISEKPFNRNLAFSVIARSSFVSNLIHIFCTGATEDDGDTIIIIIIVEMALGEQLGSDTRGGNRFYGR